MRLVEAKIGEVLRVVGVSNAKANARLLRVGLYRGDRLRLLREAPLGGPLLVDAGGREIALGRALADKIIVEPE